MEYFEIKIPGSIYTGLNGNMLNEKHAMKLELERFRDFISWLQDKLPYGEFEELWKEFEEYEIETS